MLDGGLVRASRPAIKGLLVGIDYKYSLWGLDDQSEHYQENQLSVILTNYLTLFFKCLKH